MCLWGEKWTQCPEGGSCLPSRGPLWRGWLTFTARGLNDLNGPTSHGLLSLLLLLSEGARRSRWGPLTSPNPQNFSTSSGEEWSSRVKEALSEVQSALQRCCNAPCGKASTCFLVVRSVNNKKSVCCLWETSSSCRIFNPTMRVSTKSTLDRCRVFLLWAVISKAAQLSH